MVFSFFFSFSVCDTRLNGGLARLGIFRYTGQVLSRRRKTRGMSVLWVVYKVQSSSGLISQEYIHFLRHVKVCTVSSQSQVHTLYVVTIF